MNRREGRDGVRGDRSDRERAGGWRTAVDVLEVGDDVEPDLREVIL